MDGPISKWMKGKFIELFLEYRPRQVISGMALGTDTIFALTALEKEIPVLAAIPFKGQEKSWPEHVQERYWKILNHQDVTCNVISNGGYHAKKMQIRNQWMVDNCDLLVGIFNGKSGGTKNCINYAKKVKKQMVIYNPSEALI